MSGNPAPQRGVRCSELAWYRAVQRHNGMSHNYWICSVAVNGVSPEEGPAKIL
jgi:hypothetical protein